MSLFNYEIKHKPRRANCNADNISRYPMEVQRTSDEGEDMAACGVEVTKRTPATGFVKIDEVEAKVRATIIVMKT